MTKVKICGLRDPEHALIAAESGTLRSLTLRLGPLKKTPDFPPLSWEEKNTLQKASQ